MLTSTVVHHNPWSMFGQQGKHVVCTACLPQDERSKSTVFARLTIRIPARSRWCINTETALESFY